MLTTCDKKEADQYDKMLDVADNIAELITQVGIELDEKTLENLSIMLSKNKDALLTILRGKSFSDVSDSLIKEDPKP